jgi:Na+-driven multidrug efflux pump
LPDRIRRMKDLTRGPIPRHLLALSAPIAAGMLLQTLYYFVDLYFVAKLGEAALAGVSAAGNVMFIVFALTQMLGVGTVALVSHAVGRKDREEANHVFNQSVTLAAACALVTLAGGYALAPAYMRLLGADGPTVEAGVRFLDAFIPGLALQFALVVMGSGLRGTGIVSPRWWCSRSPSSSTRRSRRCSSPDGEPACPWAWRARASRARFRSPRA